MNENFDPKELHVVVWSRKQNAFHIETFYETINHNVKVFYHENPHDSDWIIIGFAHFADEAGVIIKKLGKSMDEPAP
ncbi:MAG TPA: hypothetical protein VGO67_07445 [Verrucomicrobiae bacterium]|jgi:hypothetical protein